MALQSNRQVHRHNFATTRTFGPAGAPVTPRRSHPAHDHNPASNPNTATGTTVGQIGLKVIKRICIPTDGSLVGDNGATCTSAATGSPGGGGGLLGSAANALTLGIFGNKIWVDRIDGGDGTQDVWLQLGQNDDPTTFANYRVLSGQPFRNPKLWVNAATGGSVTLAYTVDDPNDPLRFF